MTGIIISEIVITIKYVSHTQPQPTVQPVVRLPNRLFRLGPQLIVIVIIVAEPNRVGQLSSGFRHDDEFFFER